MSGWFVVNTLPNQEQRAETNLQRQGYATWLPRLRRSRRHARRIDTVLAPLFPGYLFVSLNLDHDAWSPINGTFGVRRLILRNERPAPLPEGFIGALQETVDQDGAAGVPAQWLDPGAKIRVLSGPFVDCVGTLTAMASKDRVAVLLSVLGREVAALVSRRAVALAV